MSILNPLMSWLLCLIYNFTNFVGLKLGVSGDLRCFPMEIFQDVFFFFFFVTRAKKGI